MQRKTSQYLVTVLYVPTEEAAAKQVEQDKGEKLVVQNDRSQDNEGQVGKDEGRSNGWSPLVKDLYTWTTQQNIQASV
eukprot:12903270-Prorocentrum_lima.AAC.1